jgi:hypothetical protein
MPSSRVRKELKKKRRKKGKTDVSYIIPKKPPKKVFFHMVILSMTRTEKNCKYSPKG